jgi:hypothetical protein
MNKISQTFALSALLLLKAAFFVDAQDCRSKNITFLPEEELTYIVAYDWFVIWTEVGEITMKISEENYKNTPSYHFTAIGETFKTWDWIFKVRDKFETYVDKENLTPLYFGRNVREGNYRQVEKTWFNFLETDSLTYTEVTTNDNPTKKDTIPVPPCTFDILSGLLYARNIDFRNYRVGDTIPLNVVLDKELYPIYFRYLGVEEIKIKRIGTFECIKFSVMLIEGDMFHEGENMTVWATNDENRIPIYAESPILIGSVKVKISHVKNNRYPITSLKKK